MWVAGSGDLIPQARLEALPFARCTVEYQEKLDQEQTIGNYRTPVTSLFGLKSRMFPNPPTTTRIKKLSVEIPGGCYTFPALAKHSTLFSHAQRRHHS